MSHTAHHADAASRTVKVHIVIVSDTRDATTDSSGPVIEAALKSDDHEVLGRTYVPDDGARVRLALNELQDAGVAEAVVFTGGTGISRRDGTIEALRPALDKEIPGFGELFRMLSFQDIGASAMLSRATAGVAGDVVLFAIPGSAGACALAMEKLIVPELRHLVHELGKQEASTDEAPESFVQMGGGEAPRSEPDLPWLIELTRLGGRLDRAARAELPDGLGDAARQVLTEAGEQAAADIDGQLYGVYGYPDLRRANSKVLLVGPGEPVGEVLALHRLPKKVGIARKGGGLMPSTGRMSATAREVTGTEYPEEGRLFAVEGDAVYVIDHGRVYRWDGRKVTGEGGTTSATASLLLRWSQR